MSPSAASFTSACCWRSDGTEENERSRASSCTVYSIGRRTKVNSGLCVFSKFYHNNQKTTKKKKI